MAAKNKPINLTEIFLHASEPPQDSMAWTAAKATGNGLLWVGTAAAYIAAGVALVGLALATGGAGLPDFSSSDEPRQKKCKTTDDHGNKITIEIIHQRLQLKPDQVILAETVDPKSEFGKAGAKTIIHSDDGSEHYIKQPIAFLQKLGCNI